jgi:hypothetical protein
MYFEHVCEKCNYGTNVKIAYDVHMNTEKHKTGKNKTRTDKKVLDKCPNCDYTTKSNMAMVQHILNNHSTKKERSEKYKYYCNSCNFGTFSEKLYDTHILSKKHIQMASD